MTQWKDEKLKELRVIDGFKFRFHRIMKNEIQRWACTNKRCNAFLKFDTHGKLSNSVKREAVEQLCERPSKIIYSEITPDDLNILDSKDINLIRKNIHTARMSKYPILPKTLLEFYAMVPDVVDKLHTKGGEKWIIDIDNNKSVVCFSTIKNLNFFQKCDAVLMDGTFSSCPSLFNQLFVVHGVKNSIYVPLFFCLLVGKSVTDYCTALEFLKQRSPRLPTTFHIDFEQSIHSAVHFVERIFSQMNIVKPKSRNKMGTTLLTSLLQIRFGLKLSDKCCKNFSLPDAIVKQISTKKVYKTQEVCNSWLEYKEDSNANSINLPSKNTFDLLPFKQNIAESLIMLDNFNVVTYNDLGMPRSAVKFGLIEYPRSETVLYPSSTGLIPRLVADPVLYCRHDTSRVNKHSTYGKEYDPWLEIETNNKKIHDIPNKINRVLNTVSRLKT
ncbi:hypothetical protein AGLY_012332 [Aphis glycines]|uniref:MULE transposase domain-containing protein n=1 Tax=Aphis glycines TaxID=307491 RepID=A0A6G0T9R6_APHGL|nr:hypothetical protein AGLY_012332 [Aphis glycines]